MRLRPLIVLALTTVVLPATLAPAVQAQAIPGERSATAASPWPGGARAAVVLTYDDALPSHLANAAPALDAHGFRATFFLSNVRRQDVPAWRALAALGHELGNHSVFHACSASTFPAEPRFTTETYTVAAMLREIEQQNVLLTALDGRETHGLATPCGQGLAGGVDYIEDLRTAGLVSYVRGVFASEDDLGADVSAMDRMHIPARGFDADVSGTELIAWAETAAQRGGMAVFVFHGVAGDHMTVTAEAHDALLDWLAAHRTTVWVAPLRDALEASERWRQGQSAEHTPPLESDICPTRRRGADRP